MDHLPVGTESKSHFHETIKFIGQRMSLKLKVYWLNRVAIFKTMKGFSLSQNIFFRGGVFLQNIFSPKAAGWTQPLASENHENVENHAFQRFCHFVRPNGPDTGSRKMRNVFPVISVQSILPVAIWNIFILFVGTVFAVCFRKYFLTL